jgi:hypothetical protein
MTKLRWKFCAQVQRLRFHTGWQAEIQYSVPLSYGAVADIRTLTAYWIIRFRG